MINFNNATPLPPTFPFNMMEYITKNPPRKPETQLKLIKMCKFFYHKHPIFPVAEVTNYFWCEKYNPVIWKVVYRSPKNPNYLKKIKIDFTNLDLKFWVTNTFEIFKAFPQKLYPPLFNNPTSPIYGFNLTTPSLYNLTIFEDDWKFLTAGGKLKELSLSRVIIEKEDHTILSLEDVINLANCSNLERFHYSSLEAQFFAELNFPCLKALTLMASHTGLNAEDLAVFVNKHPNAQYIIDFPLDYPGEDKKEFKNQLRNLTVDVEEENIKVY